VDEMFNAAVDTGLPEEEEAVQQLVQILRRRIHQEIVGDVSKTFARRGDFTPIARRIEAAEDLGSTDTTLGTVLGTASFSEIEELRNLVRLGFGIPEVDSEIGGGVPKGTLTTLIGEEKGGKSMSLVQVSAEALLKEHNVYFATLELPRVFQLIRLKANLTGVPIDSIINGSLPVAKERVRQLIEGEDGRLEVKEFSAGTTTPRDIFRWVKASEAHSGNRCSVLVIDYADLLSAGKDLKSYEAGKKVYIELRAFARAHDCWVFTASQAQRKTKDRKRIKLEHVADSMHKVRIADLIISLNKADDDTDSLVWHIAGGRYCPTGAETPPLPHDFECGRVGPVNRQVPWEA
jgi:archaellum biogenesis ATPase FlaH